MIESVCVCVPFNVQRVKKFSTTPQLIEICDVEIEIATKWGRVPEEFAAVFFSLVGYKPVMREREPRFANIMEYFIVLVCPAILLLLDYCLVGWVGWLSVAIVSFLFLFSVLGHLMFSLSLCSSASDH